MDAKREHGQLIASSHKGMILPSVSGALCVFSFRLDYNIDTYR
jgi:hypothetical protein